MCGNFGLILLRRLRRDQVIELLRGLIEQTMVRGAQSAGLCTYHPDAAGERVRVVNGKRTNLAELLINACERRKLFRSLRDQQLFQGHTRFATSSLCSLDGCHPHQWSPRTTQAHWTWSANQRCFVVAPAKCESFITHNGDLEVHRNT